MGSLRPKLYHSRVSNNKVHMAEKKKEDARSAEEKTMARILLDRGVDTKEKLDALFSPGQFAVVPMTIMERRDLNANCKLLYAEITGLTRVSGYCFATDKYIADRLGIKIRAVQRSMVELEKKELIVRDTLRTKKGTFRRIFLTWNDVRGYVKNDVRGTTEMTYPVRQKRRTKGEIDKEKSTNSPLIAKSREKEKEPPAVVVSDSEKVVEPFIEIMNIFAKGVNPTLNFGHKTHRKAAQDLVAKLGAEEAIFAARYAVSIQGKQYAPTITTPYALFNKLGDLRVYYRRHNGSDGNGSIAVI